jgi:F-type H+-transporting ATPase subunit beta
MDYYVYENWQAEGHKARVHSAACRWCNSGRGIHPDSSDENGRWHGPFPSVPRAVSAAAETGGRVSKCKKCKP